MGKEKSLEAPKAVADFCRRKNVLFWWDNSFGTEESPGNGTGSSFLPKEGEGTAGPLLEVFHVDWLNLPPFPVSQIYTQFAKHMPVGK